MEGGTLVHSSMAWDLPSISREGVLLLCSMIGVCRTTDWCKLPNYSLQEVSSTCRLKS